MFHTLLLNNELCHNLHRFQDNYTIMCGCTGNFTFAGIQCTYKDVLANETNNISHNFKQILPIVDKIKYRPERIFGVPLEDYTPIIPACRTLSFKVYPTSPLFYATQFSISQSNFHLRWIPEYKIFYSIFSDIFRKAIYQGIIKERH